MKEEIKKILLSYVVDTIGSNPPRIDPDCIDFISDDIVELLDKSKTAQESMDKEFRTIPIVPPHDRTRDTFGIENGW